MVQDRLGTLSLHFKQPARLGVRANQDHAWRATAGNTKPHDLDANNLSPRSCRPPVPPAGGRLTHLAAWTGMQIQVAKARACQAHYVPARRRSCKAGAAHAFSDPSKIAGTPEHRCLTLPSSGLAPAGRATLLRHFTFRAACRCEPLMSNVRRLKHTTERSSVSA